MAVENKYIETNTAAGKLATAALITGAEPIIMVATFEVAAADDNGSVYRLFRDVPSTYIPVQIDIACDAITDGSDWDLGLYKTNLGAVITKDVLMNGQTLASALTRATGQGLGLAAVNIADATKTLAVLSAQAKPDTAYDIALTANAVGSAAGTVTVLATFVQG